ATYALSNATLPHVLTIADLGWKEALRLNAHLRAGLNVCDGQVTCEPVALSLGYHYSSAELML
ncbi:MAG TPA: hypothetical protein VMT22_23705, partial [Terriglobales bacterium]|nr:hypothetical protein [Terriglobales bacterium]